MPRVKLLATVGAAALAGGCALGTVKNAEDSIDKTSRDAEVMMGVAKEPKKPKPKGNVRVFDGAYLGESAIESRNGDPLPGSVEREGITISSPQLMNIEQIAAEITRSTDIPVRINLGLDRFSQEAQASTGGESEGEGEGGPSDSTGAAATEAPERSRANARAREREMRVQYEGKLSNFLDLVTSRMNLSWEYVNDTIRIYRYETKSFSLASLPGSHSVTNEVSSSSSEGDSGGSSELSVTGEISEMDSFENVRGAIEAIIGDQGNVYIAPSTGTLTVVAPPNSMLRAERFVESYNQQRSRQVALDVQVLSVQLRDRDAYSFDFNAFIPGDDVPLEIVRSGTNPVGATSVGWAILNDNFQTVPGKENNGLVEALSERGDVSVVTSSAVTTLNNVPVPVSVVQTQGYLESISTDSTDGTTSQSFEAGELTTGFNMNVLPKIMSDDRVILQYGVDLSENLGLQEIGDISAGNGIQVPNTKSRSFVQQVAINTGDTLVLSGYERNEANVDQEGTGTPDFSLLGGGQEGSMNRELVVIAITPTVLDGNGRATRRTSDGN